MTAIRRRLLVSAAADETGSSIDAALCDMPKGVRVQRVSSLEGALAEFAQHDYDALVLSLDLPEGGGRCLLSRAAGLLGRLPIVGIVKDEDPGFIPDAIQVGVLHLLPASTLTAAALASGIEHAVALYSLWGEVRRAQSRDQFLAQHDPLTGLPNRLWLGNELPPRLTRDRHAGNATALLFIDLDGFKEINDSLGHECGDELLLEVSHRLRGITRRSDHVVRLGGDEFLCILGNAEDRHGVATFAQRVVDVLARPFNIRGSEEWVTASVGVAQFPDDAALAADLIRCADAAMYQAKRMGKNRYCMFRSELRTRVVSDHDTRRALHRALAKDEIELAYQPQVDVLTGSVVGAEALVRWRDPTQGVVPPSSFIPVAERSGLMPEIGAKVLELACMRLAGWTSRFPGLRVAVNISAQQLNDLEFVDFVIDLLRRHDLPGRALELEITETSVLTGTREAAQAVRALRDAGVGFALDDFGTGYSSLRVFWRTPIQRVKIDQSFVAAAEHDDTAAAIVLSILHLAASKGIEATAEGVETLSQARLLQNLGCYQMQGYLFGKPVSADEFEASLNSADASWCLVDEI